jgi:tRNA dimethylallyltransferase
MKNIAILGPTGSGKTSISIGVAQKLGGEIISCDSMQIYRGMPIGTAQPNPSERDAVPYHLVDFLDIDEPYDANKFVTMANSFRQHCLLIVIAWNAWDSCIYSMRDQLMPGLL